MTDRIAIPEPKVAVLVEFDARTVSQIDVVARRSGNNRATTVEALTKVALMDEIITQGLAALRHMQ